MSTTQNHRKFGYGKLSIAALSAVLVLSAAAFFTPIAADATAAATAGAPAAVAPTIKPGDPVVATVDGEDIKRSEVVAFISTLPDQVKQQMPVDQLFAAAQDQVIANRLIDKKAQAAKLADDPEVKKAEAQAHDQIIRNVYLERQINSQIDQKKLLKAYSDLLDKSSNIQEVHARHILVDSKDKAQEVIKKLDSGAKFEDVAKEYSTGPSAKNGGDLGYFAKDEMVPEFADAAFALDVGKYTKDPVKTQFGWHVIQVLDKRKRPEPDFDAVKPQLAAQLRQQALTTMLTQLQKEASIKKFDINGEPVKAKH